jgi:hypothetical protein
VSANMNLCGVSNRTPCFTNYIRLEQEVSNFVTLRLLEII